MQTSNGNPNIRSNHSQWCLLAEYALSEIMSDNGKGDELTSGFLSQPLRALGVPPEWIGKVEMTLTGFAKLALVPVKPGRQERYGSIRVFCQKKVMDDANSSQTSRPDHAEQSKEHAPIKYHSNTIMNGGWGYFFIERDGNDSTGSSVGSRNSVDLYLYKEGE